jgi:putative component of membrane protein insertase Oxa1/YidC/SpoIIIJ protein YidD
MTQTFLILASGTNKSVSTKLVVIFINFFQILTSRTIYAACLYTHGLINYVKITNYVALIYI